MDWGTRLWEEHKYHGLSRPLAVFFFVLLLHDSLQLAFSKPKLIISLPYPRGEKQISQTQSSS